MNPLLEEVDKLTAENKWFRAKLDKCERVSEFKGYCQNSDHHVVRKQFIKYSYPNQSIVRRGTDELPSLLLRSNYPAIWDDFTWLQGVLCCRDCHRIFNERTATPFNHLQFPTDIVLLVVLWWLRYIQGSSMRARRDLSEMFLVRGFEFNKETLCDRGSKRLGTKVCPSDR